MREMTIPKLCAAQMPTSVPMPRFRAEEKKTKAVTTLTEAVHRVLARTHSNPQPFGVFAIRGRIVLSNVNTDRFKLLQRRLPNGFVGTYGPGLKVTDALEDLREHFTDEVANGVA